MNKDEWLSIKFNLYEVKKKKKQPFFFINLQNKFLW